MPDPLEFPRMLCAIVPLMRRERLAVGRLRVVSELIALAHREAFGRFRFLARRRAWLKPGFAAVVGALNNLAKPTARLRRVDAIGINGRAFKVVHLPAAKVRAGNIPLLALAVGREDKRAFARAD